MAYDKSFYEKYFEYLQEPRVRRNHGLMLQLFASFAGSRNLRVLDLGCGTGEFERHGLFVHQYLGVDANKSGYVRSFLQADYKTLDFPIPFAPNAFVSLFSIEPSHPVEERYALYDRIFEKYPEITHGISSGFYYQSKMDCDEVTEADGAVVSYQTLERVDQIPSERFKEIHVSLATPSAMFGEDVIEVWKFLERK